MVDHPADGSLYDWSEISDEEAWDAILIGNGLSINLSRYFAYGSLYEEANKTFDGCLSPDDRAIFEAFSTTNFEVVLAKLRDAIIMAEVLGRKPGPYRRRFRSVQEALGAAVRRVHLERSEIPDDTLAAIKKELRNYGSIFSTSYDLLIYWAIGGDSGYGRFCDCFWANGRNEFDPDECEVFRGYRPVYYMHGALHLVVEGSRVTRKLTRERGSLLDQFGKPIAGDPEARPLLITEASPRDKLQGIEGNDYLAHVYEQLQSHDRPLLVFGHSLGEQDSHLIDAINANPNRPVAVSMVRQGRKELRERQSYIWGRLHTERVFFYDAATHPLGAPELTINGPRFRFLGRWARPSPNPAPSAAA